MNYFDLYSSYPDRTIAGAWDSQVKEADNTPWLAAILPQHGSEIFLRFAACYAELSALPRSARRALQRRLAQSSELAAILPEYLQHGGRRLQHRMAWSLAGAALLLALGQGMATAATITVTTNNPNIIADGQCSLIEAIVNANNDAATHPDCVAGSGADTIVLPANANVTLTAIDNHFYTPSGLPRVTSRITIEGNGATIARQGSAPDFGLMAITDSGDLTLQSVTLSGGQTFERGGGLLNSGALTIKNSTISGNAANYDGGGVRNSGTLTIENSTISGNDSCCYFGGGISNYGTLTIENSTISGNTAGISGGGLFNYNGTTLTIKNSTISGNAANYSGGGLLNSGSLTIQNSTISGNMANHGGGVNNSFGGTLTIENSTISGNTTVHSGGGVFNYGSQAINNSTISGNTANHGGGVFNAAGYYGFAGSLAITNSTISGNTANFGGGGVYNDQYFQLGGGTAVLTLNNSLIGGNQANVAPEVKNLGVVTANNFNLFGANGNAGVTGFTPGPTDIVPGVALAQILGPLQNNGGPTQTHALVSGSPAIDAGDPGGCRDNSGALLSADQRVFFRTVDGDGIGGARCDIGAFEFNSVAGPTLSIDHVTVSEGNAGTINAVFTVTLSPASGQTVTVSFASADGSALAGSDYPANSGTLTFNPGETAKTITVVVNGDTLNEAHEFFFVNLSNPANAVMADAQALGTIINDDPVPSISINDVSVTEGNTGTVNALFTVTLSSASGQPVTVSFSTANGTATAGSDYLAQSGFLTFIPGETTKTITIAINGDSNFEPDETFFVNLISATDAIIADSQGVGTIVNDDPPVSLANVSTRGRVLTGDNVMIGGFIIEGSTTLRVLVRSRGPSMAGEPFNVPGTLANPFLQVFSGQTVIAQNDNWQAPSLCASGFVCEGAIEIANLGFDPCMPNPGQIVSPPSCDLEAAILITLPPGAYTAIVTGADGGTGVGLVEIFEADASALSELANVSTRGFVQNGDNVMIGGVIIDGSTPATVLIRARGPSMSGAPFFVPGTLANPMLELFSGQTVIAQNDNWQDAPNCPGFSCGDAAQIVATSLDPCQPNPGQTTSPPGCAQESAMLITLPPGAYTAIVSGVGGGTGVGLVEVFEMD